MRLVKHPWTLHEIKFMFKCCGQWWFGWQGEDNK